MPNNNRFANIKIKFNIVNHTIIESIYVLTALLILGNKLQFTIGYIF